LFFIKPLSYTPVVFPLLSTGVFYYPKKWLRIGWVMMVVASDIAKYYFLLTSKINRLQWANKEEYLAIQRKNNKKI